MERSGVEPESEVCALALEPRRNHSRPAKSIPHTGANSTRRRRIWCAREGSNLHFPLNEKERTLSRIELRAHMVHARGFEPPVFGLRDRCCAF